MAVADLGGASRLLYRSAPPDGRSWQETGGPGRHAASRGRAPIRTHHSAAGRFGFAYRGRCSLPRSRCRRRRRWSALGKRCRRKRWPETAQTTPLGPRHHRTMAPASCSGWSNPEKRQAILRYNLQLERPLCLLRPGTASGKRKSSWKKTRMMTRKMTNRRRRPVTTGPRIEDALRDTISVPSSVKPP